MIMIVGISVGQTPSDITYIYNARTKTFDAVWKKQAIHDLNNSINGASSYLDPVKSFSNYPIPTNGERYISNVTDNVIVYDTNSTKYDSTIVVNGNAVLVTDSSAWFLYNGTTWIKQSTPSSWATSGTNIFNTNNGKILIGKTTANQSSFYKIEIQGRLYCNTLGAFGGTIIGNGDNVLYRGNDFRGGIALPNFSTYSQSLDLYSGSTTYGGGRIRLLTKGIERMSIDSNGLVKLSNKTVGTSDSVLIREGNIIKYKILTASADTSYNHVKVIRKDKPDLNLKLTSLDYIADTTVFLPADSNTFVFMGGNFTATKNIFTRTSKYYAEYPTKIRTTGNFVLFDATGVNTNQVIVEGHFYGQCDYGFVKHNSNRNNVRYSVQPDSATSISYYNILSRLSNKWSRVWLVSRC
jgi:hypothetical protein